MKVYVENMRSPSGKSLVPNQYIIWTNEGKYFQSYSTIIAMIDTKGNVFLDSEAWNYSRTTSKYRNLFLKESLDDTRKKIKDGTYKLVNLRW